VRVRPYNWIRSLVGLGHQVHLVALDPPEDAPAPQGEMRRLCAAVDVFRLTRGRTFANAVRALPRFGTPLQLAYSHHPEAEQLAASLASSGRYDVVHVEHMRGVALTSRLGDVPIVYDAVDSISALFAESARMARSRASRLIARLDLARSRRFEARAPLLFSRTVVTSKREAAAFARLAGPEAQSRLTFVPNGVDIEYFRPPCRPDRHAIVFTGKLSYHANAAAAARLVERIMPLVWARRPDTPVILAGKGPAPDIVALGGDKRVTVTGYVEEMRTVFAEAVVAVCPLVYGAGIQNKALEALASGVPTIITSPVAQALSGVSGQHYIVADSDQKIADAILQLLADPAHCVRLAAEGRDYVTRFHHWETLAAALVAAYEAARSGARSTCSTEHSSTEGITATDKLMKRGT
jgi:glycosyltransferase involved in cell wall biosynthesis